MAEFTMLRVVGIPMGDYLGNQVLLTFLNPT
jgi:hypothetical protein